jgi:hypothetical protein
MQRQQVDAAFHQGVPTQARGNLWLRQGQSEMAGKLASDWLQGSTVERGAQTELAMRFELLEARAGEEVAAGLEQLLGRVLRQGRKSVACEMQVALVEARRGQGRRPRGASGA